MTRTEINRWAGVMPLIMSGAALALVVCVVSTGWERHLPDEGTAAHLFQLLIAAELPVVVLYLWTADRTRLGPVLRLLAAQIAAVMLALVPVWLFHL